MLEPIEQRTEQPFSGQASQASVATLLSELRSQVRAAIKGRLAWQMLAFLGVALWAGLVLDRLFEPSPAVRLAVEIALATMVLGWLLLVALPRWLAPLTDQQLIKLLHHHAPEEANLLSTALGLRSEPPGVSARLREQTLAAAGHAAERLHSVRLVREPVSYGFAWFAGVALAGVAVLGVARPDLATSYVRRIGLTAESWPRRVQLSVTGFEYDAASAEWCRVAARGEPTEIEVFADTANRKKLPNGLWAQGTGRRRSLSGMTRVGPPIEGDRTRQRYRQRIERLDEDLTLTIRGGDARLRLRLLAAERPQLSDVTLTYRPPDYLAQPEAITTAATLAPLPEGSALVLRARSSKPLAAAEASVQSKSLAIPVAMQAAIDSTSDSLAIDLPRLTEPCGITLLLTDADGLWSEPYELPIEVARDRPPSVSLTLEGVARAVTRDARVPVLVSVDDDYALRSFGLRVVSGDTTIDLDLAVPASVPAVARGVVDLLSQRSASTDDRIRLEPGDRLTVAAVAADRYDLGERPPSESQPIELEVVTPEELLARLGESQRDLRRTIDTLVEDTQRLRYELDLGRRRLVDSEEDHAVGRQGWAAERRLDTRKAFDGVEEAARRAEGLRLQAVNNRLDQPALIDRLAKAVVRPLRRVASRDLAAILDRLGAIGEGGEEADETTCKAAVEAATRAVTTLEQVAASLDSQQTYNEVVALLRGLVREQRRVNERTTRERSRSVRGLFE